MSIPIQNIYFLLSYAWNRLDEAERVKIEKKELTDLPSLLTRVLLNASTALLKQGLEQGYIPQQEEIAGIKGKLSLSETIKQNLLKKQKTVCLYDEYAVDILSNQILITTLYRLLKLERLELKLKQEVKALIHRLPTVSIIKLTPRCFDQVNIHRNNQSYDFIITVCQFLYENMLPSQNAGQFTFIDFTQDERKMASLFENFVHNFYRQEQSKYTVSRKEITWKLSGNAQEFLPKMQTDITLECSSKRIIIDTKYYQQTLTKYFGEESIQSSNLYQIFSYLLNQRDIAQKDKTYTTTGILLYPTINVNYDFDFKFEDHSIQIKTVDLNAESNVIKNKLLSLIK